MLDLLAHHALSIAAKSCKRGDMMGKKIVVIGGGTGASMVLRGLTEHAPDNVELSSIVAMADDGGSTGRLRTEHGTIPVGDITAHLLAMARDHEMVKLLGYRFCDGHLSGDTVRNILLTALLVQDGRGVEECINVLARIVDARGTVHPSTLSPVWLSVTHGPLNRVVEGEHQIDLETLEEPRRFQLTPDVDANCSALRAISEADLIVLAPGSIYTSILAVLLVPRIAEAIKKAHGELVMISNLLNEQRHTPGWTVDRYVSEVVRFLHDRSPDHVLYHEPEFDAAILRAGPSGSTQVRLNGSSERLDRIIIRGNFAEASAHGQVAGDAIRRSPIRHDPRRIAEAILALLP